MWDYLKSFDPGVQAALIGAISALATVVLGAILAGVVLPIRYVLDHWAYRFKLKNEYEYEQRKALRQLIGRYRGALIEAAETLNHRMWNLYTNHSQGWLDVQGDYRSDNYYFKSFVQRFMNFFSRMHEFERETLFVDAQIAEAQDLKFVAYIKALNWVATDVKLFDGLQYDGNLARDHIFRDSLRAGCSIWIEISGKGDGIDYWFEPDHEERMTIIFQLLDGLSADEGRLRWDRFVAIQMLLMSFINEFGYEFQRSSKDQFKLVARKFRNSKVLENLVSWLPRLGLAKRTVAQKLIPKTGSVSI